MVVAMLTSAVRTKTVLVLSSTRPMKGIERTPPRGRATSKKVLISTALSYEERRCSYCGRIVATKKFIRVI